MDGCYGYELDEKTNGYNALWNGSGGTEGDLGTIPAPLIEVREIPVNSYRRMFDGYLNYKNILDLSGITRLDLWNFETADIIDMSYMFKECESLKNLDISHFDTSRIRDFDENDLYLKAK